MPRGRPRVFDDDVLIDAAAAELIANGFDGLTMDAVAGRAGTSKQTLYARHSDKAGLVSAVGERAADRICEHLVAAYRSSRGTSARRQLRVGMHALADFARERPVDFQVITTCDWPGRHVLVDAVQAELSSEVAASLKAGASELDDGTTADVAALLVGLGWNVAMLARGADAERVDALAGLAAAIAADGLLPYVDPPR